MLQVKQVETQTRGNCPRDRLNCQDFVPPRKVQIHSVQGVLPPTRFDGEHQAERQPRHDKQECKRCVRRFVHELLEGRRAVVSLQRPRITLTVLIVLGVVAANGHRRTNVTKQSMWAEENIRLLDFAQVQAPIIPETPLITYL